MREKFASKLTWLEQKQKNPVIRDVQEGCAHHPGKSALDAHLDGRQHPCLLRHRHVDLWCRGLRSSAASDWNAAGRRSLHRPRRQTLRQILRSSSSKPKPPISTGSFCDLHPTIRAGDSTAWRVSGAGSLASSLRDHVSRVPSPGAPADSLMLAADIRVDKTASACASKSFAILPRSTVLSGLVSCRDATMILTRPLVAEGQQKTLQVNRGSCAIPGSQEPCKWHNRC